MTTRLKKTSQCAKCPWRKATNPREIPNGYSEGQHEGLRCTIAKPGDVTTATADTLRVMACHETHDAHCVGWLHHQLGPGNNIALRLAMRGCEKIGQLKLLGEQHKTFDDTLPKSPR